MHPTECKTLRVRPDMPNWLVLLVFAAALVVFFLAIIAEVGNSRERVLKRFSEGQAETSKALANLKDKCGCKCCPTPAKGENPAPADPPKKPPCDLPSVMKPKPKCCPGSCPCGRK